MNDASDNKRVPRRRAGDRIADAGVALVAIKRLATDADQIIDAVPLRGARHDPSFVTHLIAVAERCPQTRVLRRASPEDAMAAYRATDTKRHDAQAGGMTRQDV